MLDVVFGRVLSTLNSIASIGILLLMVLICADVLLRVAFNLPLPGVPEIARFSVVVMLWMQMAYTLRAGRHLRSTLILDRLPQRGRDIMNAVNGTLCAIIFGVIAFFAYPEFRTVFVGGDFEGADPVRIPLWPIWGIFIIGAILTAIQYVIITVRALRGAPEPEVLAEIDPLENAQI